MAAIVVVVEDGFLRNVGVPDEQVLAEGDVGPEDGEAEEQLAHEVKMLVVQRAADNRRASKATMTMPAARLACAQMAKL